MSRWFAFALCAGLLATLSISAEEDKDKKAAFDASKLVGEWIYVSGQKAGEKSEKKSLEGKVKFTKDTVTVPGEKGKDFVIGYKINAKTTPPQIDLDIKDGPIKEGKALGLIDLKDGQVHFCYVMVTGKDSKRPAKFESTKENKAFLFVLKPAK